MKNVSEVRLSYSNKVHHLDREKVLGSNIVAPIVRRAYERDGVGVGHVEAMYCLYLNRANQVLACPQISLGGLSGTVADPKIIFQYALRLNASSLILSHNHPSGNLKSSEADKRLTKQMGEAAKLLDMSLLDHVILTEDSYFSMADECEI